MGILLNISRICSWYCQFCGYGSIIGTESIVMRYWRMPSRMKGLYLIPYKEKMKGQGRQIKDSSAFSATRSIIVSSFPLNFQLLLFLTSVKKPLIQSFNVSWVHYKKMMLGLVERFRILDLGIKSCFRL